MCNHFLRAFHHKSAHKAAKCWVKLWRPAFDNRKIFYLGWKPFDTGLIVEQADCENGILIRDEIMEETCYEKTLYYIHTDNYGCFRDMGLHFYRITFSIRS